MIAISVPLDNWWGFD